MLSSSVSRKIDGLVYLFRLSETARAVRRDHLTYLSPRSLFDLEQEAKRLNAQNVAGDFLEFGLALGGSGIVTAKLMGPDRHFHGFDVFDMIPPPNADKDGEDSLERYQAIKQGKSGGLGGTTYYGYRDDLIGEVRGSFAKYDVPVDDKRVLLHKGLFEETWPVEQERIGSVALAHIDCDWFDPVDYCLRETHKKLSVGGAIVVDDYFAYSGAKDATDAFLKDFPAYNVTADRRHLVIQKQTS